MSTKHTHTPGPWQVLDGEVLDTSTGAVLLKADRDEPYTRPVERDANVRLAATAPQLAEALAELLAAEGGDGFGRVVIPEGAWDKARAALRKAGLL